MTVAVAERSRMHPVGFEDTTPPDQWRLVPLKHLARINSETLGNDTDPESLIRYVDIGNVNRFGDLTDEQMTFGDSPSRARRIVRDGDTIVSTVRTYLRAIAFIKDPPPDLIVSTGFAVLRPRAGVDPRFLFYAVQSVQFVEAIVGNSDGVGYPAITPQKLGDLQILVPELPVQKAIADRLDAVVGDIARVVDAKKLLLDRIAEQQEGIIYGAVTAGIDEAAGHRPAERIDWLDSVPKHWDVRPLKYTVTACQNGVWGSEPDGESDETSVIRVADFDRFRRRVRSGEWTQRALTPKDRDSRLLQPGNLLIEKSGGGEKQPVGAVVLYDHDEPAVCSNFIARMPVAAGYDPRYLCYLHQALYAAGINVRSIKQSIGIQNLDSDAYLSEVVPLPSLEEQEQIVAWLDDQTSATMEARAKAEAHVALFAEFREAVISAAVSGAEVTA